MNNNLKKDLYVILVYNFYNLQKLIFNIFYKELVKLLD